MRYAYVGPAELATPTRPGTAIRSVADLDDLDTGEPFTYVVDVAGLLRLAPRRSEHVACAAGADVLAAGEITLRRNENGWAAAAVSNQSTGYCPDPDCWPAVAAALDRAGIAYGGGFTEEFTFRRCPECGQRNIVKDAVFFCAVCDAELPASWNFA